MLLHHMTLVSFRLFRKNLGNLREYFGHIVYLPPAKNFPYAYDSGNLLKQELSGNRAFMRIKTEKKVFMGIKTRVTQAPVLASCKQGPKGAVLKQR